MASSRAANHNRKPPATLPDPSELDALRDALHHGEGVRRRRSQRIQYMHEAIAIEAEVFGMDTWLDNLETILRAISQRRLSDDQLDRFALLLGEAARDALHRGKRARLRRVP